MSWSDDLRLRTLNLSRHELENPAPVDLHEEYRQSERPVGAAEVELTRGVTARVLQQQAYLPTTARLGAGWQALPWTHLGVSYYGALTRGRLAGTWNQMLGVGVQQRIPLMLLRAGYATDLADGSMLSGGVSLGALEIGVARLNDGSLNTAARRGWVGAVGLNVRTRTTIR
jgi:hypothetical protein